MERTIFFMPRAKSARGKVRGALPRIPARGTPPETPGPLSLRPHVPERPAAVKGALRKIFSNPEKIFLRRANYARP